MVDRNLAIVIPAYKKEFLDQALASIAAQTNKNFTLYIGDDNSPNQLYDIVKNYETSINLSYSRFEKNVGGYDLIKQWTRCIDLTNGEEWIWLFSDDDVMEDNCVESFYKGLKDTKAMFDVYRFNTYTINKSGSKLLANPVFSNPETSYNFLLKKLNREIDSYVTEYVFSSKIYYSTGGFVSFPLAWASDDATWTKFSKATGIYTLQKGLVYWRTSDINISNTSNGNGITKAFALLEFAQWGLNFFNEKNKDELRQSFIYFIFNQLSYYSIKPTLAFMHKFSVRANQLLNVSYIYVYLFFFKKYYWAAKNHLSLKKSII